MFKVLTGAKILLYSLIFIRALQKTPITFPLIAIMLALLVSGFWRSYYKYDRNKVNIVTLCLDLILAAIFSQLSESGSFDKLFILYLTEGTAILPPPFFAGYAILTAATSVGMTVLYGLRESGQLQVPGIVELLLYGFVFVLVLSERRQREQRIASEKLAKELKYVNHQLKESMALSENLATEAERRRIVGEVHDSLGYNLTGLILSLEAGKKLTNYDVEAGKDYWDKAIQGSRAALQSVRELVSIKKELYFEFDLASRLREMAQEVRGLTGLWVDVDIEIEDMGLTGKEQFNMYRIFQEAITNTLRHANADRARISISGSRELLYFAYQDNGIGTPRIDTGNGLQGMRDRGSEINAAICFYSQAGHGFIIEGRIDKRGKKDD